MEEKLLNLGYKVWEKNGMRRIYVDYHKYLEVEVIDGGMGRGRIINGFNTTEYAASSQKQALELIGGGYGTKLYYDCKELKWVKQTTGAPLMGRILDTVIEKINNL